MTFGYSYFDDGTVKQYTGPEGTINYTYDGIGQLLTATGETGYSYDTNGNRTLTGYVTEAASNRLLSDGLWDYEYDDEGNLLKKTFVGLQSPEASHQGVWWYSYDHRNRMIGATHRHRVSNAVLVDVRFTYDAMDHRIVKEVDSTGDGQWDSAVKTIYDGDNPYMDLDINDNVTTRYLHGQQVDQLFARIDPDGDVDWYLTDRLGSVRQIANLDGTVDATLNYDSFGNLLVAEDPDMDRFRYTSREWDSETGLQYNRARYYDPAIGRWLSEDPIRQAAGDQNLYRYVGNSPTNATDPTGEFINVFVSVGRGMYMFSARFLSAARMVAGQVWSSLPRIQQSLRWNMSANKVHHIFDKVSHGLGQLAVRMGGRQNVLYEVVERLVHLNLSQGRFVQIIRVGSNYLEVKGVITVDGIVKIGSMWILL